MVNLKEKKKKKQKAGVGGIALGGFCQGLARGCARCHVLFAPPNKARGKMEGKGTEAKGRRNKTPAETSSRGLTWK